MPLYYAPTSGAAQRNGSLYVVVWDTGSSSWWYQGATITARPAGMLANDQIFFVGNPGGALPAWSAANDSWNNS